MKANKVIYYGEVLVDMSQVTVKPETLGKGETALDASGELITGTHECPETELPKLNNPGTAANLMSGKELIDGDGNVVTGTLPSVEQATPSIAIDLDTGEIIARATQTAGVVPGGTKREYYQLDTQAAQTITPGTVDKTIAVGLYLTGTQTIKGDANLLPENIVSGKTIFGVAGTAETGGGGGSGGSVEACTVGIKWGVDWGFEGGGYEVHYVNENLVWEVASGDFGIKGKSISIQVAKNTVLYLVDCGTVAVDSGNVVELCPRASFNPTYALILSDANITASM